MRRAGEGVGQISAANSGQWQAARPIVSPQTADDYTLVSCTVGPGFDFNDFSFMRPDGDEAALLRHHWPELAALI